MYRNNVCKNFKITSKYRQPTSSRKSKENLENSNILSENSEQTFVRSTTKILNLFKNTSTSCNEKIPEENIEIQEKEDSTDTTASNKLYVHKYLILLNVYFYYFSNDMFILLFSIFNVVIGTKSMRKHKKWDDDGTLEVTGKRAILKVKCKQTLYIVLLLK